MTPDFPALLEAAIAKEGVRGFARRAGISPGLISRLRKGRANRLDSFGPTVLAALGWEKVVSYRRIRSGR